MYVLYAYMYICTYTYVHIYIAHIWGKDIVHAVHNWSIRGCDVLSYLQESAYKRSIAAYRKE